MSKAILIATAATTKLDPSPIPKAWVLSGSPEASNKELARSHDRTSYISVWECTPGRFTWHYTKDEALVVLSGEVFITNEKGEERRMGSGDLAFFPGGSSATWRVTERVRKVAILRQTMPRPLGFCLRAWNKALQLAGLKGAAPFLL